MPSHPDRVRRNYHDIKIGKVVSYHDFTDTITIKISKLEIATKMHSRDLRDLVIRRIEQGIYEQF
jgi:hypothetical protein